MIKPPHSAMQLHNSPAYALAKLVVSATWSYSVKSLKRTGKGNAYDKTMHLF